MEMTIPDYHCDVVAVFGSEDQPALAVNEPHRRRIDWIGALMATVTALALGWAAWLRFGPPPMGQPPAPGSVPPPPDKMIIGAGLSARISSSTRRHSVVASSPVAVSRGPAAM